MHRFQQGGRALGIGPGGVFGLVGCAVTGCVDASCRTGGDLRTHELRARNLSAHDLSGSGPYRLSCLGARRTVPEP